MNDRINVTKEIDEALNSHNIAINELTEEKNYLESLTDSQRLAKILHDTLCSKDHVDLHSSVLPDEHQCSWVDNSNNEWTGDSHNSDLHRKWESVAKSLLSLGFPKHIYVKIVNNLRESDIKSFI